MSLFARPGDPDGPRPASPRRARRRDAGAGLGGLVLHVLRHGGLRDRRRGGDAGDPRLAAAAGRADPGARAGAVRLERRTGRDAAWPCAARAAGAVPGRLGAGGGGRRVGRRGAAAGGGRDRHRPVRAVGGAVRPAPGDARGRGAGGLRLDAALDVLRGHGAVRGGLCEDAGAGADGACGHPRRDDDRPAPAEGDRLRFPRLRLRAVAGAHRADGRGGISRHAGRQTRADAKQRRAVQARAHGAVVPAGGPADLGPPACSEPQPNSARMSASCSPMPGTLP